MNESILEGDIHFIPKPIRETIDWLIKIEAFGLARELGKTVIKYFPDDDPRASDFLAYVLHKSKFYVEACGAANKTTLLQPLSTGAKFNAAKCFASAGHPEKAEVLIREALLIEPDWIDAQIDLAYYISIQGRHEEAMKMFVNIMAILEPTDRNAEAIKFNLGWHLIRHGRFRDGMKNLSKGRALNIWGTFRQDQYKELAKIPLLDAKTKLRGMRVLICGEGGAGDEIINVRFARSIVERGAKVVWACQRPLASLFQRIPNIQVLPFEEALHFSYNFWAPCMDLPWLLDLDLSDISGKPYLSPDAEKSKRWTSLIPKNNNLKVGIRWQGNVLFDHDLMRSIPFKMMAELMDIEGVDFYSLQRDEGREELLPSAPITDLGDLLSTWEETAAAIDNLDVVISSCTSVAHLAAAMGKPTWILCPLNSYYIWATPGPLSPWYETVRLFRQEKLKSWIEPISNIKNQLSELASSVKSIRK